jgi:prephenate dehydratase|tara:strand:+ start:388 stop:1233 length:846 start_codon:yes stop_codon:yes gene_type:complete
MNKIAFQGSFGAYSHLACNEFYPDYESINYRSFKDVFQAVIDEEVDYGILPLENSYAGRVSEIHNLLQNSNLFIAAEHFLKIEHNLVAPRSSKISDIKKIYSHPQALMQCSENINKNIEQISYSNTADAAAFIANQNDKTLGAICSKYAAKIHNLEILQENMQDTKNDNMTIFMVISKKCITPDPNKKIITTLSFTIRNISGALYKSLGGFATNNINMIKLESYIPGGISQQAKFFISIEGSPEDRNVALALSELGFFSKTTKLIGIYNADPTRFNTSSNL